MSKSHITNLRVRQCKDFAPGSSRKRVIFPEDMGTGYLSREDHLRTLYHMIRRTIEKGESWERICGYYNKHNSIIGDFKLVDVTRRDIAFMVDGSEYNPFKK